MLVNRPFQSWVRPNGRDIAIKPATSWTKKQLQNKSTHLHIADSDSGASHQFTNTWIYHGYTIINHSPLHVQSRWEVDSGHILAISHGYRDLQLPHITICLHFWYVPDISVNRVSISQLAEAGFRIIPRSIIIPLTLYWENQNLARNIPLDIAPNLAYISWTTFRQLFLLITRPQIWINQINLDSWLPQLNNKQLASRYETLYRWYTHGLGIVIFDRWPKCSISHALDSYHRVPYVLQLKYERHLRRTMGWQKKF